MTGMFNRSMIYPHKLEESASYYDEKFGELDILTDARHGWKKNAKDSHQVLSWQQ